MVFSFVKTDLNWLVRISALSVLSDFVWWSFVRVGIPTVSIFRLLMQHINRVVESEQTVGLSCFFMCVVVWLTTFVIADLVSMYFMGVEGSLFLLVQSFYTSNYM